MPIAAMATLDHPILGRLRGRISPDAQTTQYRNLKYASILSRWQDPTPFSQKYEGELDATKFGPACPQHPGGYAFDLSLYGDVTLEREKEAAVSDEFECLNLVVTVPRGVDKGKKLPVMVCGGFSVGSNSWPQYDLSNLVQRSIEIDRPVIAVSINYRLGPLGFLASDELGISGNYGLKDQACAFKWIQVHIAGFGGDSTNITAFGESAGSICLATLLHHTPSEPLFQRAILMSGDSTIRRPRDMVWQNNHYFSMSKIAKLDVLDPQKNQDRWRDLPAMELVATLPIFNHWSPAIDGEFLREAATMGGLSDCENESGKPDWCREILIGDCAHDGTVLHGRILARPDALQRLYTALAQTLSSLESQTVLEAYGLSGTPEKETLYNGLMNLATDLRFHLPVVKMAEGWVGKEYRYHFHQPNPIAGQWKSYASHELDISYLLGTLNGYLPDTDRKLGKEVAGFWIGFANGEGLSGSRKGEVLVIGPESEIKFVRSEEYDDAYRRGREKLWEKIGWEKWFRLGELLQGV